MKRRVNLSSLSILVILLMLSGSVFAQNGRRGRGMQDNKARMGMQQGQRPMAAVLDLSDDQKDAMLSLRTNHQKEIQLSQNLLNEKRAHLKTLLSAPDHDKKAINKTIDEMSSMKADMLKSRIANHEEMKSILTPEQLEKVGAFGPAFGRMGKQGFGQGQGFRQGHRGRMGQRGTGMGQRGNRMGQRGNQMGQRGNRMGQRGPGMGQAGAGFGQVIK